MSLIDRLAKNVSESRRVHEAATVTRENFERALEAAKEHEAHACDALRQAEENLVTAACATGGK